MRSTPSASRPPTCARRIASDMAAETLSAPRAAKSAGDIRQEFSAKFPEFGYSFQDTYDGIPTAWVQPARLKDVLRWLKNDAPKPYKMLFDLTAIDERLRVNRHGQPEADFTVVYTLLSF